MEATSPALTWHTGETIPAAAQRISTEAQLDQHHDSTTFCFGLLQEATHRVTRSEAGDRGAAIRNLDAVLALTEAILDREGVAA